MDGMFFGVDTDASGRAYCVGGWETSATTNEGVVVRYDADGGSPTQWTFRGDGAGAGAGDGAGAGNSSSAVLVGDQGVFVCGELRMAGGSCGFVQELKP